MTTTTWGNMILTCTTLSHFFYLCSQLCWKGHMKQKTPQTWDGSWYMFMQFHICSYICECVYIYMYVYIYTYTYCIHMCIILHVTVYIYIYIHKHIYIYMVYLLSPKKNKHTVLDFNANFILCGCWFRASGLTRTVSLRLVNVRWC